jgi:branched-chain amino acid transport system substrate-binding protein
MDLRLKIVWGVVLLAAVFCAPAAAQSNSAQPYATIDHTAINYLGPDRSGSRDLKGPETRIGLLVPLQGPRKLEGESALVAARLALEEAVKRNGTRLALAVRDESGPWGRTSSEMARLVFDDEVVAVVTSSEGGSAHLAEQIGNRIGVPVLTLATDSTTTEINLPWIFRLPADDRAQAAALAEAIYSERHFRNVLLIAERDHDGRAGGDAFEKAATSLSAPALSRVDLDSGLPDLTKLSDVIHSRSPEAVLLWTGTRLAGAVVPLIRRAEPPPALFLCQKAAAGGLSGNGAAAWTSFRIDSDPAARRHFEDQFELRAGRPVDSYAASAYDAISLLASAVAKAGSNRARVRDQLALTRNFAGVSGGISFDGAGNNLTPVRVVALPAGSRRPGVDSEPADTPEQRAASGRH